MLVYTRAALRQRLSSAGSSRRSVARRVECSQSSCWPSRCRCGCLTATSQNAPANDISFTSQSIQASVRGVPPCKSVGLFLCIDDASACAGGEVITEESLLTISTCLYARKSALSPACASVVSSEPFFACAVDIGRLCGSGGRGLPSLECLEGKRDLSSDCASALSAFDAVHYDL
jgi:hypothetical protein